MSEARIVRKVVLAGAVEVSRRTLQALIRHHLSVAGVLGHEPRSTAAVSGYCRLDSVAKEHGLPYVGFANVNDSHVIDAVRSWQPDLLFVVGLSQIVKTELLGIARFGSVGFHPTRLPEGRGRAPVPWMILEQRSGAATFFLMDDGADSGPILAQEPFDVLPTDYASDVHLRIEQTIDTALDRWLPTLATGDWIVREQDHSLATYRGRRAPEDGLIDWRDSAEGIHRLVRACSRPYPGAYTYVRDTKLFVWRAERQLGKAMRGVLGRVVDLNGGRPMVQTGDGLLELTEFEAADQNASTPALRIGERLGRGIDDQMHALTRRVADLERALERLTSETSRGAK